MILFIIRKRFIFCQKKNTCTQNEMSYSHETSQHAVSKKICKYFKKSDFIKELSHKNVINQ